MYEVCAVFHLSCYVECLSLCQFSCCSGLLNKSVKNSCTSFHENPMNVSVTDCMSQMDGHGLIRCSFYLIKNVFYDICTQVHFKLTFYVFVILGICKKL